MTEESARKIENYGFSEIDLYDQVRRIIFLYKKVNPEQFASFEHELDNPEAIDELKRSIANDVVNLAIKQSSFSGKGPENRVSRFRSVNTLSDFHKTLLSE